MTSENVMRGRSRAALAALGLALAACLAVAAGGAVEARVGALPPCGKELPMPGHPGETYEIPCPSLPDPDPTPPYDFQEPGDWPWPGPINP
ncbi:hypothetical protein GCM10009555_069000 [Acrocarpospora macrocephala]|uniref:Lipoprotein n=1 Tax=Acrocarpospora macrocephala TaxID=150177 RepID=A0A5M3X4F2_9ACTN|nr:hypothetical protein [Acrocarpospora macrocephala]GES16024.1 hypothetical protein Amac_096220 [Acrocarpospora macrocephala]